MSHLKNLFYPKPIVLNNGKEVKPPFRIGIIVIVIMGVLLYFSAKVTNFNLILLINGGEEFFRFLGRLFPPNLKYATTVMNPMIQTFAMSFLGTLFAGIFALPMAYLSASNMNQNRLARGIVRFVMSFFRTIPVLIIALIMTYIFGLGTFSGMIAIFLFTFSILTKMTYEQIELVDMGPFEASISTGASRFKAFVGSVVPQISGLYLSSILYNLEMNIRSAAVLGYVGAGGIGTLMNENIGWRQYQNLSTILIILLISVILIEMLSRYIRKRLI